MAQDKARTAVSYLGTDFSAGRCRAHVGAGLKRNFRVREGRQRLAKAAKLKSMRQADSRFGKIFTTGIKMGSHYGVEVNGVDDDELLTLRRQALSFLGPMTRGASLRAKLVLHGEPMVREAMAPALQWCKMIWQACTFPASALVGLNELERLWTKVFPRGCPPRTWAQTRGPIARIPLCLARAGWAPVSASAWRDQDGITIHLPQVSPAMLLRMLQTAF